MPVISPPPPQTDNQITPDFRFPSGGGKDLGLFSSPAFHPRLLFVSSSSGDGGADRLPVALANALDRRGASVLFACHPDHFTHGQCQTAAVQTVPFSLRNSGDLRAARQIARLIVTHSIDVVHVHARRDFMVGVLGGLLARRERHRLHAPRPRVVLHSHLLRALGAPPRAAGRFFEAGADAVIAVSAATEQFLNAQHGLRPGFVRCLPNGVDLSSYALPRTAQADCWRAALRQEWQIAPSDVVIGMVGRLFQKGQTFLLAAAGSLLQRFPQAKIVLVGPERDPGDQERLAAMAARLGIGKRVIFAGTRSDIPACMAAFDILAHLPRDEAFGLVIAEAMASGLPTIASDAGGCREVVGEERGGCLVPLGDVASLISALTPLLDGQAGDTLRALRGKQARRAALTFGRDQQIDQLLVLYAELCSPALVG